MPVDSTKKKTNQVNLYFGFMYRGMVIPSSFKASSVSFNSNESNTFDDLQIKENGTAILFMSISF